MRLRLLACTSGLAIGFSAFAQAQEVTTYQYDALGRLVGASISGGNNSGITTATCFDAAGNRSRYVVNSGTANCSGATPTPTPGPTPSPTPTPTPAGNLPPVANADTISFPCNTTYNLNITANDTDPENNIPLTLQSITRTSGVAQNSATVSISSTSTIHIIGTGRGMAVFTYVVADSLGATSSGQVTITLTGPIATCIGL